MMGYDDMLSKSFALYDGDLYHKSAGIFERIPF